MLINSTPHLIVIKVQRNRRPAQPVEDSPATVDEWPISGDRQPRSHPPKEVEDSRETHNTSGGIEEDGAVAFWQGKATHQDESPRQEDETHPNDAT